MWNGMKEGSRGRGKEGCAIMMSERMWKGLEEWGWKGTRIVWAKTKVGIIKYAWVSIYAPVNVKSGKDREKMREIWDEVNDCLGMFEEGRRIVVFGDMNST